MTFLEIFRAIESKKRVEKIRAQEKASYDYILADLIGQSIARLYSSSAKYPDITTVYPTIFSGEDIQAKKQEQQDLISAIRFKQFAHSYNARFGGSKIE